MSDSHGHTPAPAAHGDPHAVTHHHDVHDEAHHIAAHLRMYWWIGGILGVLTGVTVLLSYVDFGTHARNVVVGMIVATIKVALVAAIFMHLKGEKPTIYRFLYFTVFFFAGLFLLILFQWYDPIFGTTHATR